MPRWSTTARRKRRSSGSQRRRERPRPGRPPTARARPRGPRAAAGAGGRPATAKRRPIVPGSRPLRSSGTVSVPQRKSGWSAQRCVARGSGGAAPRRRRGEAQEGSGQGHARAEEGHAPARRYTAPPNRAPRRRLTPDPRARRPATLRNGHGSRGEDDRPRPRGPARRAGGGVDAPAAGGDRRRPPHRARDARGLPGASTAGRSPGRCWPPSPLVVAFRGPRRRHRPPPHPARRASTAPTATSSRPTSSTAGACGTGAARFRWLFWIGLVLGVIDARSSTPLGRHLGRRARRHRARALPLVAALRAPAAAAVLHQLRRSSSARCSSSASADEGLRAGRRRLGREARATSAARRSPRRRSRASSSSGGRATTSARPAASPSAACCSSARRAPARRCSPRRSRRTSTRRS